MSGICGVAGSRDHTSSALVAAMLDRLRHRGPDGVSLYAAGDGTATLGHARLRAFDQGAVIATGFACSRDGVATLDGGFTNAADVWRGLPAGSAPARPGSDADLALLAYRAHGDDCLARLDGPFAFALWDNHRRRALLARDKLGEKSLYYTYDAAHDTLVFASEVKAILAHPLVRAELDLESLSLYFAFGYIPGPRTLFRNIFKLLPGERLVFEAGRPPERARYWRLPPIEDGLDDEAFTIRRLRALFMEGLEAYAAGSRDVAVFLSGGVDSSIIVAGLRELGVPRIHTFTVGFDVGPSTSHLREDLAYARMIAAKFSTEHHEVLIDARQEAGPGLLRVIRQFDDLIMTPNSYSKYLLASAVREAGLTSVLTGSAAAGACGVHRKYLDHQKRQRLEAKIRDCATDEARYYKLRSGLFDLDAQKRLLAYDPGIGKADILDVLHDYIGDIRSSDFFRLFLFSNLMITSTEKTLRVLDRSGSLASVEIRSPYLHRPLVDFSTRLPSSFDGHTYVSLKTHLKQAFEATLPAEVLDRPVMGYPSFYWNTSDQLVGYQRALLNREALERRGILNPGGVRDILEEEKSSDARSVGKHAWALTQFCLWYEMHIERNPAFLEAPEMRDGLVRGSGPSVAMAQSG